MRCLWILQLGVRECCDSKFVTSGLNVLLILALLGGFFSRFSGFPPSTKSTHTILIRFGL